MFKKPIKPHPDHKLGATGSDELLCERCINEVIEVIRSSVVANEKLNDQMRNEIDEIFVKCQIYQSQKPLEGFQKFQDEPNESSPASATTIHSNKATASRRYPVKDLALQLQKLTILDARLKISDIQRSKELLSKRVALLQAKVDRASESTKAREEKTTELRDTLFASHQRLSKEYTDKIARLRLEDATRVSKQAAAFQYDHYKVIRQVVFTKFDIWKLQQSGNREPRVKLDLYGQPIIPLEAFLSHNNKLIAMNTFIENLIRLQILMVELLESDGTKIHLPFLDFVKTQLPDSHFFNQVQEKINFLVDDPNVVDSDTANETPSIAEVSNGDVAKSPAIRPSMDKIVVRDNKIQIPLSFKTANLQRRASVRSANSESPGPDPSLPEMFSATPEPASTMNNKHSSNEKIKSSGIQGKRMVIVPHKILTKPFTKLTLKEYLKFVSIVVKILINFDMLLRQTIDKVPVAKKKQTTRDLLLSTYDQLRGEVDTKTSIDTKSRCLDLRKTLEAIATMDKYFQHKIDNLPRSRVPSSNNIISLIPTTSGNSFGTFSGLTTATSANGVDESSRNFSELGEGKQSSSKLKEIYSVYLSRTSRSGNQGRPLTSDNEVYGAISVGYSDHEEETGKSSIEGSEPSMDDSDQSGESEIEPFNIKEVMTEVHKLVANGKGTGRESGDGGDEAVRRATKNMMKTTQSQLADWDVVSRLY